MKSSPDNSSPWDRYQDRIKAAISRAADEHETVDDFLVDLSRCEEILRTSSEPITRLEEAESPASAQLRAAMETHKDQESAQYDGVCAANIVLASMNAIVHRLAVDQ